MSVAPNCSVKDLFGNPYDIKVRPPIAVLSAVIRMYPESGSKLSATNLLTSCATLPVIEETKTFYGPKKV